MAAIVILRETEEANGWRFAAQVSDPGGPEGHPVEIAIHLSWADYDHWCRGQTRPEEVARRVLEFLLSRRSCEDIPRSFDAAKVRLWYPDADGVLGGV